MQYRALPKHPDIRLSALGFGCMRLPVLDRQDPARIDEERAAALIRRAVAGGVNYLDTAYPYHAGASEPFVGRLLKAGLPGPVYLATKLPTWLVKTEADWERLLDEQLRRLDTPAIDFYLLHSLSAESWETVLRLRGLAALERARADGRIRQIGFSFHGSPSAFDTIVNGYPWDFCQIQYNFLDEDYQAGTAGLRAAGARGIGVIVMEPLRGGALAAEGPADVRAIWTRAGDVRTPAARALRWVWHHKEVVTALSGMNAPAQLDENLAVAGETAAGSLAAGELELYGQARDAYRRRMKIECTTCGYCAPCPNGVSIPEVFAAYNSSTMFDAREVAAVGYRLWVCAGGHGADACLQCGECEPKCPQRIPIVEKLQEAHAHLLG